MNDENGWGLKEWEPPIDKIIIEEIIWELRKLYQNNPYIIAAAFSEKGNILFSTDNWDISGDVDRIISNWVGLNAHFLIVSGVRYLIFQMESEQLVAIDANGPRTFIAFNSNYKYFLFLNIFSHRGTKSNFIKSTFGNLLKLWSKYFGTSLTKRAI